MTNNNDIIPSVPRLLGYSHVRHSVKLNDQGGLDIQVRGFAHGPFRTSVYVNVVRACHCVNTSARHSLKTLNDQEGWLDVQVWVFYIIYMHVKHTHA